MLPIDFDIFLPSIRILPLTTICFGHFGFVNIAVIIAEFPEAKIIVISGDNAEQLDYATDYGAIATMTKPIAPEDLRVTIAEALGLVEKPVVLDNTHII